MRQASQASINPRSSPQGANKRSHGPIPPNWPRPAAQSRRDLYLRHPQTTPTAFLHSLDPYRPSALPYIVASAHDDRDAKKETIHQ